MGDETTLVKKEKKTWWKRPEIIVPAAAALMGGGFFSGLFGFLGHIEDIWNEPLRVKRLESRVYLIEKALKVNDPTPFSGDVTNSSFVYQSTNQITIDP